jgi:glucuronoxylan 4-O-methyltransferase
MSDNRIRELVASNPGQATVEEYKLVFEVVRARAPCRMLVFGVGRDSALWMDANAGGTTVFLESIRAWADYSREHVPGITVHEVHYRTLRGLWPLYRRIPALLSMGGLPASVTRARWDVILVDAPKGTRWYKPGRMKSVYTARALAAPGADIFVHDCHRPVEREASDFFLDPGHLVAEVDTLRHYRLP